MLNKKAIVTKGSYAGDKVFIEDTDLNRLGKPWHDHHVPAAFVYADREVKDGLPESGTVYCGMHLDGKKEGLSDFFHEDELQFLEKENHANDKDRKKKEALEMIKIIAKNVGLTKNEVLNYLKAKNNRGV